MKLSFKIEKGLFRQGFKIVAGVDEAGRGPWAGPIVAAILTASDGQLSGNKKFFKRIKDSKLLSDKKRRAIYNWLIENWNYYGVGVVEHFEIDEIGIGEANRLVVRRAINNLKIRPHYILSDYIAKLKFDLPYQIFKKGESVSPLIAAASIIAKVYRDDLMLSYHQQYPQYGFDRHKGYGTRLHSARLKKFGPCVIHRQSFSPIKDFDKINK